jgi:hypothetical protein
MFFDSSIFDNTSKQKQKNFALYLNKVAKHESTDREGKKRKIDGERRGRRTPWKLVRSFLVYSIGVELGRMRLWLHAVFAGRRWMHKVHISKVQPERTLPV